MTTTDTTVNNLIINTMTQAQYNQITPSDTELYLVTDSTITSSEVTNALGYTPTSPANVDGQWNYTFTVIHSATALGKNYTYYLNSTKGQEAGASSSNIFDILPNDNYKYEILIMASGRVKVTGPSIVNIATTAWANPLEESTNILALRGDGTHSLYNINTLVIPIDTDRKIQVAILNTKPDLIGVTILGYRRIGTNL